MEIRRIEIQNFRGIKSLAWNIPAGRRFLALIGPGDSTKSSILSAIDMTLSDRWNLSLSGHGLLSSRRYSTDIDSSDTHRIAS